ncbi:MAG: hypothetical protein Q8N14_02935 [Candidatus Omnitrophota bacterium]|nr:hypothetical protein [Candidatus Omnitrophota bacterium]
MIKRGITKINAAGIVIPLALSIIIFSIGCSRQSGNPLADKAAPKSSTGVTEAEKEDGSYFKLCEIARNLELKRDPFSAEVITPVKIPQGGLSLSGIFLDAKIPKAIIGDTIVGVGDKIEDKTITEIKKDRVILSDGSKDYELRLEKEE